MSTGGLAVCSRPGLSLTRVAAGQRLIRPVSGVQAGSPPPSAAPRAASHPCYSGLVAEEITQRELRNDSGEIMRALDRGDCFVVTRNGVPVGELVPLRRRQFVRASAALSAFAGAPTTDAKRFRAEVDALIDQDVAPRG
jgi:antitoxin (DNA-binding transcriptional repressor) of toxin-antitoxin stability system